MEATAGFFLDGLRCAGCVHRVERSLREAEGVLEASVDYTTHRALVRYDDIPRNEAFAKLANPQLEKDCVLSGGDDYELVFTAAPERRPEIENISRDLGLPVARVGIVRAGEARLVVVGSDGQPMSFKAGFDHFRLA